MKSTLKELTISINLKDLPLERTVFEVLRKEGIKGKVEKYLDWLKQEYPSAKNGIEKVWNDVKTKKEWGEYSDETDLERWLKFIRRFTFDVDIIKGAKEEMEKKLNQLFSSNDLDNDIKKDLKTQPIKELLDEFVSYKTDEIAYAVELYKGFYLDWLPKCIEESLKEEKLTFSDLNQEEWKKIKQKIFTDLRFSWENTAEANEIDKLREALGKDIIELGDLIEKTQKTATDDLKRAKEKYQKEDSDGKPWNWSLSQEEKDKINQAKDKQELDKAVAEIKQKRDKVNPEDLAKADKWIKENISDKTKLEDLPTEKDIDDNNQELADTKLPPGFKEKAKLILREKEIELFPEPTNVLGKIKKHLMTVRYKWRKWDYLFKQGQSDDEDYILAKMFNEGSGDQSFGKITAPEMDPKIKAAIDKNTLEGYKALDREWGQNKIDKEGKVEYDAHREYMNAWNKLRNYLEEREIEERREILAETIREKLGEIYLKNLIEIKK